MAKKPNQSGYIFRASIKTKDGRTIYAKDHGKKAFRIPIDNPQRSTRPLKGK